MLIKNSTSVGFQCCVCGKIAVQTMELFDYGRKKNIVLFCPKCHSEIFRAEKTKKGGYNVDIGCPVCFTPHRYDMTAAQLWNSEILSLKCAFEDSETLIIGKEIKVVEIIKDVFEPFEPFTPGDYYLDDYSEVDDEAEDSEVDRAVINNFLRYLRMMSNDSDDEFLSVEDVLDSSYIPDEDMTVVKFIINICRMIEKNLVECKCGKCNCGTTDVETEISGDVLAVICNSCGRRLEFGLAPESIAKLSTMDYISIT